MMVTVVPYYFLSAFSLRYSNVFLALFVKSLPFTAGEQSAIGQQFCGV